MFETKNEKAVSSLFCPVVTKVKISCEKIEKNEIKMENSESKGSFGPCSKKVAKAGIKWGQIELEHVQTRKLNLFRKQLLILKIRVT